MTKAAAPAGARVTALRVRHLLDRVAAVHWHLQGLAAKKAVPPEPVNVRAARKLVKTFDKRSKDAQERAHKAQRTRTDKVRTLILRGDFDAAVSAVEQLEREASNA